MAAPLFYGVAAIIGLVITRMKRRSTGQLCVVLAPILLTTLEGSVVSFDRTNSVTATAHVAAAPDEVRAALAGAPRFDRPLPLYLRLGFPRPVGAEGGGLEPGDVRIVHFRCCEGQPGDLVLAVEESRDGYVRFAMPSDSTRIARWMKWKSAEVRWRAEGAGTRVEWTVHYERTLDPAWYFGPFMRYATWLAAGYLIETAGTP